MRVQLILVGGRSSIPNALTIIHQQPQVVVTICSKDTFADVSLVSNAIHAFVPSCIVDVFPPIDAFDMNDITQRCEEALQKYPDSDWLINITAGTAIMSIAAYEVARCHKKTCWYLNTNRSRIVTLSGEDGDETVFKIDVPQYIAAYNRVLAVEDLKEQQDLYEQRWLPFAQLLGRNTELILHLKKVCHLIDTSKEKHPKRDKPKDYCFPLTDGSYNILKEAEKGGIVSALERKEKLVSFSLDFQQDQFLNGKWLEVYVWQEANNLKLFNDCQWNKTIIQSNLKHEIDVSMTYKAQLLIAECKTGTELYETKTLDKLVSIADLLGGKFVGKILISSLFAADENSDREQKAQHQKFLMQTHERRIVVAMAEELPHIGEFIREEATTPKYARI